MTNVYKRPAAELGEAMGLAAHLIAVSAPPLTGWGLTLHVGKASGSLAAGMPGAAGGGRDIDAPEVASSAGVTVSVTPHALRRQITIGLLQGVASLKCNAPPDTPRPTPPSATTSPSAPSAVPHLRPHGFHRPLTADIKGTVQRRRPSAAERHLDITFKADLVG